MKHLQRLASGMNTVQACHAIARNALWEQDAYVVMRGKTSEGNWANWYGFDMFPQLRPFVFGVMGLVEGEALYGVTLWQLKAGQNYVPLREEGQLYFVVLATAPGLLAKIGDELAQMLPGEVWWADQVPAEIVNNSGDAAIFLQIEIEPNGPATYIPETE